MIQKDIINHACLDIKRNINGHFYLNSCFYLPTINLNALFECITSALIDERLKPNGASNSYELLFLKCSETDKHVDHIESYVVAVIEDNKLLQSK
jgi:hypothetical protein